MLVRLAILGLILTAVGAAIIYTWWQDEDAPLATLRDGSGLLLFTGTADEVVAAASREIGFTVHPIRQPDYALVGIQLQPHPAEVPHGLDMVTLAYETKLTRGKPGRGAVEVYQAPVVFDSPMNGPFGGETRTRGTRRARRTRGEDPVRWRPPWVHRLGLGSHQPRHLQRPATERRGCTRGAPEPRAVSQPRVAYCAEPVGCSRMDGGVLRLVREELRTP